ncbi:MAG: Na-K-Cl cotransporter [Gemmatimonadota bacterium]
MFTPSILTILGVIMYLRFGWVVGNVGLAGTLLIVTLATSITFLTALSIAEIATDQRVRVGGAYYMISRSLGIETGGAVGIPLYLAQALSVALYTVGFAESVVRVFPSLDQRIVGLITTLLVALLALRSARAALRAQYVIMVAIALSLLSFVLGHAVEPAAVAESAAVVGNGATGAAQVIRGESFWMVFAVFFPAVTGIMAGVNMSGDLKQPGKSIPRGTLAAVGVGYLVYMGLPLLLSSRADAATLIAEPFVMRRMALVGQLIIVGVWGATLSSAVGSILGAPRVLQALARDGVLPRSMRWLGKGSGGDDAPRNGTWFTLGIALVAVWFGNLNLIAPILTMFFLTTYGVLNISAATERFLGSPSFRPKFRVHWVLSALGAVGCAGVMFLINPLATLAAAVIVGGIYIWLERRELRTTWGDIRRGMWMAITRAGLFRLQGITDARNWRPHLLVLSGSPTKRWHLIALADALAHNRAFVTVSSVLTDPSVTQERQRAMEATLADYLARRGVHALTRLIRAPTAFEGAERLMEAYGIGSLVPNTMLLGASESEEHRHDYAAMLTKFHAARRNVVVLHHNEVLGFGRQKRIDVWWGGLKGNGGLMMTLAYLLQTSVPWRGAHLRIKMVVPTEAAAESARDNLTAIIRNLRTPVSPEVIVSDGRPFGQLLAASSAQSDLIFMGMKVPDDEYADYLTGLSKQVHRLPTTAFVLAAEDLQFSDILFAGERDEE